jgi:hypothetical protein
MSRRKMRRAPLLHSIREFGKDRWHQSIGPPAASILDRMRAEVGPLRRISEPFRQANRPGPGYRVCDLRRTAVCRSYGAERRHDLNGRRLRGEASDGDGDGAGAAKISAYSGKTVTPRHRDQVRVPRAGCGCRFRAASRAASGTPGMAAGALPVRSRPAGSGSWPDCGPDRRCAGSIRAIGMPGQLRRRRSSPAGRPPRRGRPGAGCR